MIVAMLWQTGRTFENTDSAPAEARSFVRAALNVRGLARLSEPTLLAVSELITNAVTHGRGRIALTLSATADGIRVAVADEGGGTPVVRKRDPEHRMFGGWGLHLIDRLADDWGVDADDDRTVVWFELATDPRPGGG